MRYGKVCMGAVMVLLGACLVLPGMSPAENPKATAPNKALCAEMIRFGVQSYQRSKYLDAKEYFRKAIQADPSSAEAWQHYDLSVIYALAEKVNKDKKLIAPDASPQGQAAPPPQQPSAAPPASPPAEQQQVPAPALEKKPKFKIVDDEGC